MPTPLPPNLYAFGTPMHTAYSTCLASQAQDAPQLPVPRAGNPTPLVCARLLGYMIIHAPTPQGRSNICDEVNSCSGNSDMFHNLAKFYVDRYLRCLSNQPGQSKDKRLAQSDHPSRPSFDEAQETIKRLLEKPPKNHAEAKAAALERDGYRCMVTGTYDMRSCEKNPDIAALAVQGGTVARETHASHIFAPSTTGQDISGPTADGPKHSFAASAWAFMERIGGVLVPDELNGPDIHRLENVMTLETGVHILFDNLKLWFEPTGGTSQQHQYRLCSSNSALYISNLPQTVTFTSTSQQHLPLPDPRCLALHAACAKVAYLSGAGEYIDSVDRDLESTAVLATCGSSAGLLEAALNRHIQSVSAL